MSKPAEHGAPQAATVSAQAAGCAKPVVRDPVAPHARHARRGAIGWAAVVATSVAAAASIVFALAGAAPTAQAALVPPPAMTPPAMTPPAMTPPAAAAATPPSAASPAIPAVNPTPGTDSAPRGWQLRCWQQGRLLFEENAVQLPADASAAGLRLRGVDRHGAPVYVTDSQNATCLIRREPPSR